MQHGRELDGRMGTQPARVQRGRWLNCSCGTDEIATCLDETCVCTSGARIFPSDDATVFNASVGDLFLQLLPHLQVSFSEIG
jgi:hypothetical protein